GSRVGWLANLTVEGGDRRGVDDHAALALSIREVLHHEDGCQADDIEGADQIDLDDTLETLQRQGALPANDALSSSDTGAVDHNMDAPKALLHLRQGTLHVCTDRDIGLHEEHIRAKLCYHGIACLNIEITQA